MGHLLLNRLSINMWGDCQSLQALHNFLVFRVYAFGFMLLGDEIQGAFRLQNAGALKSTLAGIGIQHGARLVQVVIVSSQYLAKAHRMARCPLLKVELGV